MRIIYFHQYFKTPAESGAVRSWYLASGLVKEGYSVTIITGGKISKVQEFDGFTVHYVANNYSHNGGALSRIIAFISYMLRAYWVAAKLPEPDIVYATSTPLTVLVPALLLKWTKGIPFIFEVRDLWPEAPIALKVLKHPFLQFLARLLAIIGYQEASAIIALSPDIKKVIEKLGIKTPIEVIPNIANKEFFETTPNQNTNKPLTIGYFGTMGLANGINQAIPLLKAIDRILPLNWRFVYAGEGTEKIKFQQSLKAENLLGSSEKWPITNLEGIKSYLAQCHFSYVSFSDSAPILGSGSPNKFFDSLAAGVPVIVNFEGWIKQMVETNHLGFYQNPEAPNFTAQKIIDTYFNQSLYQALRSNCATMANNYSKELAISKLSAILKKSLNSD